MAARKLELISNGTHCTFSFTDSQFFVHRRGRGRSCLTCTELTPHHQWYLTDKPKLDVPLQRVLWADSSESRTVVHVLAKKSERRGLILVKAEGNAKKGASDELAREWSKLLMDAAYAGKSSTCIGRVPFKFLACIGVKQQRRFKIFINPNSGPVCFVCCFLCTCIEYDCISRATQRLCLNGKWNPYSRLVDALSISPVCPHLYLSNVDQPSLICVHVQLPSVEITQRTLLLSCLLTSSMLFLLCLVMVWCTRSSTDLRRTRIL